MAKDKPPIFRHLIEMSALNRETITYLLDKAELFLETYVNTNTMTNNLGGYVVSNLFFESSTRTRHSFEIAAARLGATYINSYVENTSLNKGETILDTVHALESMGTRIFVVRHSDNHMAQFIAAELISDASIVNAGDGKNQHPSQGLLDLMTIRQHKGSFDELKVSIVGDILHSRVATSLIQGLTIMGTKDIYLVAPTELLPEKTDDHIKVTSSLSEGLKDADVVVALRIQKERIDNAKHPNVESFAKDFGISLDTLSYAKPDAIVMHPGPMNRGIEIDSNVADGPQSVIWQQVRNGIAMRMAILDSLIHY